jgi:5'(3')-deoxyribonucleotidase
VSYLIASPDYEPYILTAPSVKNPLCYTEKRIWVEEKFGLNFVPNLIICANKGLLKGDVLVDDNIEGKGQENFDGRLIHFGSEQNPNWASVLESLTSSC